VSRKAGWDRHSLHRAALFEIPPSQAHAHRKQKEFLAATLSQFRHSSHSFRLDRTFQPLQSRDTFRLILRQCHRRLDWPSGHRSRHQVLLRDWICREPPASSPVAPPVYQVIAAAFAHDISCCHRHRMGLAIRQMRPDVEVGTSRRQHRL